MSFRRDYLPLFSIHVIEDATGAAVSGVKLRPTSRCQRLLADHQLLVRPRDYGLDVYYTLNPWEASPLLGAITSRVDFDFSLHLPGNFYDEYLPDLTDQNQLHLNNLAGNGSIKPGNTVSLSSGASVAPAEAIRIVAEKFEIPLSIPPGASSFEVRGPFSSAVVYNIPISELGGGERIEFDLRKVGQGRYRLSPDNQPTQHTHVLLDNEVVASRAQGLVSIALEQSQQQAPATGYRFEARFESR